MLNHLSKRVLRIAKQPQVQNVRTCYSYHDRLMAVLPRAKVSLAETLTIGLTAFVTVFSVPVWVLYHLPHYRGEERKIGIISPPDDDYDPEDDLI